MGDPLSVPSIGASLQAVEAEVQGIPQMQLDFDRQVIKAEQEYIKAQARANGEWQVYLTSSGRKPLAAERELFIFEKTEDEWYRKRDAEIQADYARSLAKARYNELTSLQSRMKGALEAGRSHAQVGRG